MHLFLRTAARLLAVCAGLFACAPLTQAASVPAGFQEYHVLGHEGHVYAMFNRPVLGQAPVGYALSGGMLSVVSATASSDNQIIYYDHWENGFEADIFAPVQANTLVLGNGIAADGNACEFIPGLVCAGVDGEDVINRGDTLNLTSIAIPPPGNAAAPACATNSGVGPDFGIRDCVPIPRNAADVRFDGGDRMVASGGPVSLVHVQEPTANVPGILGGAVEVLPLQAVTNATSYSVPVGQDTFTNQGGNGTAGAPFRFVDLDIVAFQNNTQVQVVSPGAGTVNFTLQRGQHWSSQGAIDQGAGPALVINEGTKVSVNKPVAGLIFASSNGFYGTRTLALLPDLLHSNDYLITAPGDNTGVNGTSVHDLYIYNPGITPISVTTTDTLGSNLINVPANSVVPYTVATGRPAIPNGSTVRLTSSANFWGITAYDSRNTSFDWGHSWLAVDFLTDTYTVPYAPDNPNRTVAPPSAAATPGSAASGASPAFVAATENNTCVRVDFDNNGVGDSVRNGAGQLVAFSGGACADGYLVNALRTLRIYDNNAADGTLNNDISGARVRANKPVALSYGLDTDSAPANGPGILDLGYAIYPVDQRFLNPVLTIGKTSDISSVPTAGGIVTYTLEVRAYDFAPLNELRITDLLPDIAGGGTGMCVAAAGVAPGYICNSTTITYPNLSTTSGGAAEPGVTASGTRDELTWTTPMLAPDVLQKNEVITVSYQVRIPAGPSAVLSNRAEANAKLGVSSVFFTPSVRADVVRTDVRIAKSVTDDGTPEPGDILNYTLVVTNNGVAPETNIVVSDAIPTNTQFCDATQPPPPLPLAPCPAIGSDVGFSAGAYNGGQNAVVWTAANLGAGQSRTLTFPVRVNPTTPAGSVIENTAGYESTQTRAFDSNPVNTAIVGPDLVIAKSALGNPDPVFPEQFVTYEVTVENIGAGAATNVFLEDIKPANATYVTGSMRWKRNAGAFAALSDASDGVEASGGDGRALDTGGTPAVDEVEFRLASLGPGEDLTFQFQVRVNTGTSGMTLANQATVASDQTVAEDTNLVQSAITNPAVRGRVFLDVDGDGSQDPGEPGIANVDVVITDGGGSFTVTTDSNGDYFVNTVQNGNVTVNVDETDPDFPDSATETTGTDGQNLNFTGTPLIAAPVGYQPPPLTATKTSDAPNTGVAPGDTITYTVSVTNNSTVPHTQVTVSDPLPANTSYVPESTRLQIVSSIDTFRDEFDTDGAPDGNNGTRNWTGNWTEIDDGNDFDGDEVQATSNANSIRMRIERDDNGAYRDANLSAYTGGKAYLSYIARRESMENGKRVRVSVCAAPSTCGASAAVGAEGWTLIEDVIGTGSNDNEYLFRVFDISGFISSNTRIRFRADNLDNGDRVYFDNIQIAASNGALAHVTDGVNAANYTGSFGSNPWLSNWLEVDDGNNDGPPHNAAAGDEIALSDQNNFRLQIQDNDGSGPLREGLYRGADLSAFDHALLTTFYRRDNLDNDVDDFVDISVCDAAANACTDNADEGVAGWTLVERLQGTGSDDPDAIYTSNDISGAISSNTLVRFITSANLANDERVFFDEVQILAVADIVRTNAAASPNMLTSGAPPNLVVAGDNVTLAPGGTMTVTFQVTVDDPLAGAVTQISNTATINSNESVGTVDATRIDPVVRPDVSVEPNSAGIVLASGSPQTVTFAHRVTNLGTSTDSFALAAFSERNLLVAPGARYSLALIDPATGVVIATDSDGDGFWDGGVIPNTGSLTPGANRDYLLRVTVPGGTAVGTVDRLELRATSDLSAGITGSAFDTVTVHDGGVTGAGDVVVTPDNASSVPSPPGPGPTSVAYTHTVENLTGGSRAFQLQANSSQGFTTRIFQDTNNDGVYTPGVDVAITQTTNLANGASQRVFVVIDVPAGTPAGTVDSTSLAASFFDDGGTPADILDDTSFGGTATDTTTVTAGTGTGDNTLGFSLSGGGTQVVGAGTTAVYPGELTNLGSAADRYAFTIGASVYADDNNIPPPTSTQPDDGLPHASQLVLDTDGDGDIDGNDRVVAEDLDGDGIWDRIDVDGDGVFDNLGVDSGPFDLNGDGIPDFAVAGGTSTPYELRRPVDPSQGPYADPVTLTATSTASGNADSVTATTSVQSATLAVISEFRAYASRRRATVEWVTHSEHGTVGFHLERLNPRNGRWVRINARLLPALLHSRQGALYRLRDRGTRAGRVETYRLLELEATGATLEHGPYTVKVADAPPEEPDADAVSDRPSPDFERVERPLDTLARERAALKVEARHVAALARAARRGTTVKVAVRGAGLVRLRAEPLAAVMGLDTATMRRLIARNRLELRTGGDRVATHAEGDSALLFYAEAVGSPYTDENVYWIRRGGGLRMAALNARSPEPVALASQPFTAHAEGNRYHITHLFDDPDGDYWMWDYRFEDMLGEANETQFVVPTPDVTGTGTATVTVRLHGALEALHRVRVTLKGSADVVHESEWRGLAPHTVSFDVPASDLAQAENRIEVQGLGSGDPDRPSTFYINDMDIRYPRLDRAHDGRASLDHVPGGTRTVDGFTGSEVMVFDITRPKRARWMRRVTVSEGADGTAVTFAPLRQFRTSRILAIAPGAVREPVSLVADRPSLLTRRDHSVDWLLITSADMVESAEVLAKHRRDQGLRAMVVDIEDVYDEFAHGVRDAEAIWSLLDYAHRRWRVAPRYVVLAGEGSFDYKDYLGNGDSIIPTLLAPTGEGLFPSDNLFADVAGNDFLPEMAIGRLPVIDAAELEAVARKIIDYEASSGPWTDTVIFGADPADAGGDFAASSDRVQDVIPPGTVHVETLHLDPLTLPPAVARDVLHGRLNEGRAFVNFFGHAASGSLGNLAPALINAGDLLEPGGTLDNGANLPIVTAFTCLLGQFGFPGADGVGELLVVTPDRGAAAVFSPSGLSRNVLAERLGQGFYEATYGDGELVIGDAIRKAQRRYVGSGAERYVLDIYNLLGDPATIMK